MNKKKAYFMEAETRPREQLEILSQTSAHYSSKLMHVCTYMQMSESHMA